MKSLKEFVLSERKDKPPFDTDKVDYAGAAKKIRAYAKKSGGIDKDDMLSIANQLDALSKKSTPKLLARTMANIGSLDTDVRDKVKELMKEYHCMEAMEEAVGQYAKQWMKGAKSIKVGDWELVRGNGGVHKILKNKKPFGDFSLDDEADLWVSNMKGMKGQWTGDSIDGLIAHLQKAHEEVSEEVELEEGKSSTGYELYHKDFSSAMKHAYDFAKKKFGIEVDPKEIDAKVASGPRKPSKGKTNSYRLMGKDGKKAIQVQVYGMDNGKYELNMYKESVELEESKVEKTYREIMKGNRRGQPDDDEVGDYIPRGMTKKDMAKLIDMLAKQGYDKKFLTKDLAPLVQEDVELTEESKTIAKVKEIADKKSAQKIDGVMVDMFTASAIAQVYDKVNDANKAKMDKLKIGQLASLAMKMMKREGLAEETISEDGYSQTDTLDGSDLSHSNVMDPDTLQAVNAHIGSIAEREYMNPKGAMIQLQNKLHLIGLTFDIPQFAEENGVEEVTITQFGGITGKSVTTPIDQLDNENPVENMKLRIEYETLRTNKVKLYAKIV